MKHFTPTKEHNEMLVNDNWLPIGLDLSHAGGEYIISPVTIGNEGGPEISKCGETC